MQPDSSRPVLLCLPAMGVAAGFYTRFAQHLSEATGAAVEVLELRGQGAHEERAARGADYGYREIVEIDIPAAVDRVEAALLAQTVEIYFHAYGVPAAMRMVRQRRGTWFDPDLCDRVLSWRSDGSWWSSLRSSDVPERIVASEPGGEALLVLNNEVRVPLFRIVDGVGSWAFASPT